MRRVAKIDLAIPEIAASRVLNSVYSRATVLQPCVALEIIKRQFAKEGGSLAQYEVGLGLALKRGWLALNENGTCAQFTQVGIEEYV